MAQAQGIAESDFPIDAFPAKVQSVILGMVRHENFKVEYLAAAILYHSDFFAIHHDS